MDETLRDRSSARGAFALVVLLECGSMWDGLGVMDAAGSSTTISYRAFTQLYRNLAASDGSHGSTDSSDLAEKCDAIEKKASMQSGQIIMLKLQSGKMKKNKCSESVASRCICFGSVSQTPMAVGQAMQGVCASAGTKSLARQHGRG